MSKLLTPLIAFVLVAVSFVGFSNVASADWGEGQGQGISLALLNKPAIDLINCDDGKLAQWNKSTLTFRINNLDKLDAGTIAGVRAGVVSWNSVGGPYKLTEVTSGPADITVNVKAVLNRGRAVGWASGVCRSGSTGMEQATIEVGAAGLTRAAVRNVIAHETGHALGLGHANREGDLMQEDYNIVVDGLRAVCASNLDSGALRATSEPYSLPLLGYSVPLLCQ